MDPEDYPAEPGWPIYLDSQQVDIAGEKDQHVALAES